MCVTCHFYVALRVCVSCVVCVVRQSANVQMDVERFVFFYFNFVLVCVLCVLCVCVCVCVRDVACGLVCSWCVSRHFTCVSWCCVCVSCVLCDIFTFHLTCSLCVCVCVCVAVP